MRLSSDSNNPDYHKVVHFVDKVTVDGAVLDHCVAIDTTKGEAVCITQPVKPKDGHVQTHVVRGSIGIVWRDMDNEPHTIGTVPNKLFERLKDEWTQRDLKNEL